MLRDNSETVRARTYTYRKLEYSLIESRILAFGRYQNRWPWMTLNDPIDVIWRYFTQEGSFWSPLAASNLLKLAHTVSRDKNVVVQGL